MMFHHLYYTTIAIQTLAAASLERLRHMDLFPPPPKPPIVLDEILTKRYSQPVGNGLNPARYIELYGGREVPLSAIEPDPATFRSDYYYNSRHNRLYKRLRTAPKPVWKVIS